VTEDEEDLLAWPGDPAASPLAGRWMYYDRNGVPITSTLRHGRMMQDLEYRRIALDVIGTARVSTVWLGIDHNFGMHGPPIIFETMVFDMPDGWTASGDIAGVWEDRGCWRYATEEEARAGHEAVCAELRVFSLAQEENDVKY